MDEVTIYNVKGQEAGRYQVPPEIFGLPWNGDLVHQVIESMKSSARKPVAHTKTRGEVSGGGKKPWRQKGTGRARHGSTRSPIWVGGGVAHGPRNDKNFVRKVNQKMKAKALYTILSRKYKENEVVFVDSIPFSAPKAKEARELLTSFGRIDPLKRIDRKKNNTIILALDAKDENIEKSFRNFGNVKVDEARNLNPVEVASYKFVMFVNPKESVKIISDKKLNK